MASTKTFALTVLAIILLSSLVLALTRTGYLPWLGIVLGALGCLATLRTTELRALKISMSIAILVMGSWAGSLYYVYSNWESGEIVDISLNDQVTFRTWVANKGSSEVVIYDCPPEHQALLENTTVATVSKGPENYRAELTAVPVSLDSELLAETFGLYEDKYAKQSLATDVYYLTIGPKRGSQLFVLTLKQET